MHDENILVEKYINQIKVDPENTKKLFAIGFIATTGVGKSTTSQKIAERLGLFVASNDEIRRFLNKEGIPGIFPDQELVQRIAEESSRYLYDNKISHVIDADLIKFHATAKKNAEEHGAKFFLLHLVCPEDVIMKHLNERDKKISELSGSSDDKGMKNVGHSLSSVKEYEERTKVHKETPLPDYIFMRIDTSLPMEPQLDELEGKLIDQGVC